MKDGEKIADRLRECLQRRKEIISSFGIIGCGFFHVRQLEGRVFDAWFACL